MQQHSTLYTIGFSAAVCVICSLAVSSSAVILKSRQQANARLDRQRNVLLAAGLVSEGESLSRQAVRDRFQQVEPVVLDLETGEITEIDPASFDPGEASKDPAMSRPVDPNPAQVRRVPNHALVYRVLKDGDLDKVVLPVEGKGLWSTLYGFLAVGADGDTIRGLTFYQHGETPGLGGEVDNPRWKALWPGRKIHGPEGNVKIEVIKGSAGPPAEDPHHVDGLSGATITSRGVSHLVRFWTGPEGYGAYLEKIAGAEGK
ncbi:MAG: Na(+)-translocating NADH-quinone reductase subunit C [Planctomycetes bacterium]|nr:Na(+)-translocating NADH-quinone reductase subunit C [Planctomycetota bacterium]